jgi:hypothetical protein
MSSADNPFNATATSNSIFPPNNQLRRRMIGTPECARRATLFEPSLSMRRYPAPRVAVLGKTASLLRRRLVKTWSRIHRPCGPR